MKEESRSKNSLIYLVGSVFNAASGLISIPLITHILTTAQFGVYDILLRIANIVLIASFLGCRQSYVRFFYQERGEAWQKTLTGTMTLFMFFSSLVMVSMMLFMKNTVFDLFLTKEALPVHYYLMLAWVPLDLFFNLGMLYLMIREKAVSYVSTSIIRTVVYLTMVYLALYHADLEVKGLFLANIVATGSIALWFLTLFVSWSRLSFSRELLKDLLRFGLPIIPAAGLTYVLTSADRFFLSYFGSMSQVGIYALAAKISFMSILFIQEPFTKIWSPLVFKSYREPGGREAITRTFELFIIMNIVAVLALSIFAPFFLPFLASDEYLQAVLVIPLCACAASLYAVACMADIGISISKKTEYKSITYGIAAAGMVAANLLLVPVFGIFGSAVSSIIGFFLLLLTSVIISDRFYYLPVRWGRMVLMLVLMVTADGTGLFLVSMLSSVAAKFIIGIFILMFYILVIFTPGIMPGDIRADIIEYLRNFGKRLPFKKDIADHAAGD